jgi:hypothetical protein
VPRSPAWASADAPFLDHRCPLPLDAPFTAEQADQLGVSAKLLAQLLREGLVRRVVRGTYAAGQVPDTIELRASALALVVPPSAIVVDRTAAWLHGVDILPRSAVRVAPPLEVFSSSGSRLRRPGVGSGIRALRADDVDIVGGVRVTSPRRTALDLGRLLHKYDAIAALDGFLRLGVPHEWLLLDIERFKGMRGVVQLRSLAPLADARSESPPESVLRLHWIEAPLPTPELQWWVHDDDGYPLHRLDLACPECKYAAEYFGEAFHTDMDVPHDHERLTWLREERGWTIDVFRRHDVYAPQAEPDRRLRAGLQAARAAAGRWVPQTTYIRS